MREKSDSPVGVGLIGCGTVGSGVVKLLVEQADLYQRRLGRAIEIRSVLCRADDVGEHTAQVPDGRLVHDIEQFFATGGIDVVLELAGGTTFAKTVVQRALALGKPVVTANKALLAHHGKELFALARKHNAPIAFEASCGGGIPFITALQHNLIANRIDALYGILNGTCNYILTQMIRCGETYEDALAEAQRLGYAEADPTLDVNGGDTAHKLAILASLAFNAALRLDDVPMRGIDGLDLADVHFGHELGYEIKLLGIAERIDGRLALSVEPCFLHGDVPLAQVSGSFNAISLFGHAVGHTLYYGRGAGQMPTASAVVGDLINLISGAYGELFRHLHTWPDQQAAPERVDADDLHTRFYLRANVRDEPGVIGHIATLLGEQGVSLAAFSQHETVDNGQTVPVVIVTHGARAGDVRRAVERIAALDVVDGKPVLLRLIDMPEG